VCKQAFIKCWKIKFCRFHPPQRKLPANLELYIFNHKLRREYFIKYLGILIDSNLTWRNQVNNIVKKVKRNVGILSKLRYYVDLHILIKLYYALIYPILIYGIISWGNTYNTTLQPLFILQKKAIRIMIFSNFDEHSSPLFKLYDLVTLYNVVFMYKFHNNLLPIAFDTFFTVWARHIIITLDFLQKYLTPYQKLEQIMGSLILDFRAQNYGIVLVKILNPIDLEI
jgi:hypothetical protein